MSPRENGWSPIEIVGRLAVAVPSIVDCEALDPSLWREGIGDSTLQRSKGHLVRPRDGEGEQIGVAVDRRRGAGAALAAVLGCMTGLLKR